MAWTCDQDAYACRGQKCSAQSILFAHEVRLESHPFKIVSSRGERYFATVTFFDNILLMHLNCIGFFECRIRQRPA